MSKKIDKTPKITILVPTYNLEKLISKCLDSLLDQTFEDIEIICIDDHSEDKTCEIIKEYSKKDDRIRLFENPAKGVSSARNFGIDHMRGEYLMFCDGDDYYDPTMCEIMLDGLERSAADVAICEVNMVYLAHQEQRFYDEDYCNLKYDGLQKVDRLLIDRINVFPCNKIYRKSTIDKYNLRFPDGKVGEDACFNYMYFCVSETALFIRKRLYYYVRRPDSAMSQMWSKQDEQDVAISHLHVIIALYDFLKEHGIFEKWAEFFWGRFQAYEELALRFSKTKASKNSVEKLAADFVNKHAQDFELADVDAKGAITSITTGVPGHTMTTIKRLILRLLPTYNIQIQNLRRMEALEQENAKLAQRISKILNTNWED